MKKAPQEGSLFSVPHLFQLSTSLFFTKYSTPEYRVVTAITATQIQSTAGGQAGA